MMGRSFVAQRRAILLSATAGLFVSVNARAQKRRRIGALTVTPPDRLRALPVWAGFLDALRTYGWSEDSNLELVLRATGGDMSKAPALADELLNAGVELLLANDTPMAQ